MVRNHYGKEPYGRWRDCQLPFVSFVSFVYIPEYVYHSRNMYFYNPV